MTSSVQRMVREFHKAFGLTVADNPTLASDEVRMLRKGLVSEEAHEVYDELLWKEEGVILPDLAKELADLAYVVYGTAVSYGIDLDPVIEEVHRSNMSKIGPGGVSRRADGKILKPDTYVPPDIEGVLRRQQPG